MKLTCTRLWGVSGHEHALLVANHRSDIDWLVGWVLAQVSNFSSVNFMRRLLHII